MTSKKETKAKETTEIGKAMVIESTFILSPLAQESGDGQRAGLGQ
jgi:hypothetical protein